MPSHDYIYLPTGDRWPAVSVNSRLKPVPLLDKGGKQLLDEEGEPKFLAPSKWLDQFKPVEQMTWAPGLPQIIEGRLIRAGSGWLDRPGASCFNLYHPPVIEPGDPTQATKWIEHARLIYPAEHEHIIKWLAHRVQFPGEKINHALLFGGGMGIGKDTLLAPVLYAIGAWNFQEASPIDIFASFTQYLKAVILRINEARDLWRHQPYRLL